jgi:hypothetical protein
MPIGYWCVGVNYRQVYTQFYAHRLIWRMMTGTNPPATIDHINGIPTDNRWSNLRRATQVEQTRNSATRRDNANGLKGVWFNRPCRAFQADIHVDGRRIYLGRFSTADEAHAAYIEAAKRHFGAYWSNRKAE